MIMKRILTLIVASCFIVCNSFAQKGPHDFKPEFTIRQTTGFSTAGPAVTAGVKMDDKMTFGLWLGNGVTHIDAAPGDIYAIQTAAYMRRYIHLGTRDIVALYGELALGCDWVYRVDGKYVYRTMQTGEQEKVELINDDKGDVLFYAGVNAGVRFRIARSLHIFLGPTFTTNTLGLHLGIGF